jgi:hypothetical protein
VHGFLPSLVDALAAFQKCLAGEEMPLSCHYMLKHTKVQSCDLFCSLEISLMTGKCPLDTRINLGV